jgi:hypothetical protein
VSEARARFGLGLLLGAAVAAAPGARADERGPSEVVVLKRAGVTAYEEVAEEFGERCRVRAHVISFGDEGFQAEPGRMDRGELLVTVGQEALDAVRGAHARVIPTLAFHTPPGLLGPPASPPPELVLRVLTTARPHIHTVGAIFGARSAEAIEVARKQADRMGLKLLAVRVSGGPEAVRTLHKLIAQVDALWLPGDTDVVTSQVFQYALTVQLERGLPLAAATREQVHSGALMAVDFSPRAAGRAAANIANRFLEGRPINDKDDIELYGGARITINAQVARRLGVDSVALSRMGAKVE